MTPQHRLVRRDERDGVAFEVQRRGLVRWSVVLRLVVRGGMVLDESVNEWIYAPHMPTAPTAMDWAGRRAREEMSRLDRMEFAESIRGPRMVVLDGPDDARGGKLWKLAVVIVTSAFLAACARLVWSMIR